MNNTKYIRVHFVNLNYYASEEFTDLGAAISYAKRKGFEVAFWRGEKCLGSWSILTGVR